VMICDLENGERRGLLRDFETSSRISEFSILFSRKFFRAGESREFDFEKVSPIFETSRPRYNTPGSPLSGCAGFATQVRSVILPAFGHFWTDFDM
jgi:hypothetical protein